MNKNPAPQTELKFDESFRKVLKIPGQTDKLPEDWKDFQYVVDKIEALALSFGFAKVEPSLFESHDIVRKFRHTDRQPLKCTTSLGTQIAFRTSALPGLIRMYVESRVPEKERISKWYYLAPVVSQQENPHQLISSIDYGFEVLGDESPVFDAQILALGWKLYNDLAKENITLEVGSRGCENCWPEYRETLSRAFASAKYSLCKECAQSVEKNPEKILSCQEADCQSIAADAPAFIDYLDPNCSAHLTHVLESLDELGVPYTLMTSSDGEEHTKRTVFKFHFNHPQDSFTLSRGGRHDGLFRHYELDPYPALGLSGELSKLLRAWRLSGGQPEVASRADVAIIPLGELGSKKSLSIFSSFWDAKVSIVTLLGDNSLKMRLQQAGEMKIPVALIIGQKEALDGTIILRDVRSGMQEVFTTDRILSEVKKRLGD